MKTKLIYLLAFLAIGFTACDKTEEGEGLNKEQADAALNTMADDMAGDISGIMNTEGGAAIESLANLMANTSLFDGGEAGRKPKEVRQVAKHLYKMFVPSTKIAGRSLRSNDFVYEEHTGIYNYNFELADFERTDDSDVIEINFPTEGSNTLNGQLVISDLDIIEYTFSDEFGESTDSYPTSVVASLKVDGTEQASVDLEIAYNNDFMPISADVSVYVNPYSFEVSFANSNTTAVSIAASIKKGAEVIAAIDLDMVKVEEDEIKSVNGFVQYRTIKLQGSVTNPDYMSPEPESLNDFIKLSLYQNSSKIGNIEFILEQDGFEGEYEVPYLVYNDGTKKTVESVLEPIFEALEEELEGVFGDEEEGRKLFQAKK